jgi:hypothetical protein
VQKKPKVAQLFYEPRATPETFADGYANLAVVAHWSH